FQAEDGIRDLTVTGVQTCALPISAMAEMMTLMMVGGSGMEHMKMAPMKKGSTQPWSQPAGPKASQPAGPQVTLITPADTLKVGRSEERRVGKECRTGWCAEHRSKK